MLVQQLSLSYHRELIGNVKDASSQVEERVVYLLVGKLARSFQRRQRQVG